MTTTLTIDPVRVSRALAFVAIPVGRSQYRVAPGKGGEGASGDAYYYYVQTAPLLICYCSDAVYRNTICKHLLAALIQEEDPRLLPYRANIERARAAQKGRPVYMDIGEGHVYPDALTLAEALAKLTDDERAAGGRRLAGRILTDPAADLEVLRQVARHCSSQSIRAALLRIPTAAVDGAVRKSLVDVEPDSFIIGRLLPTADEVEFRALFRKLIEIDKLEKVMRVAEEYEEHALRALHPEDLIAFLQASNRRIREFGMNLLGRLKNAGVEKGPERAARTNRKMR